MSPADFLKSAYDFASAELRARSAFPPFAALLPRDGSAPRFLFADGDSLDALRATLVARQETDDVALAALFSMGAIPAGGGALQPVLSVHMEGSGRNRLIVTPYHLDRERGEIRYGPSQVFEAGNEPVLRPV